MSNHTVEHSQSSDNRTAANLTLNVVNQHDIPFWKRTNTDFMYSEGFMMRSLVVLFLCIMVAIVLVYVRGLKDRKPKYGSLNNKFFEEKAGLAGVRLIYDDEDDEEITVFESSKHKLLSQSKN